MSCISFGAHETKQETRQGVPNYNKQSLCVVRINSGESEYRRTRLVNAADTVLVGPTCPASRDGRCILRRVMQCAIDTVCGLFPGGSFIRTATGYEGSDTC